MIVSTKICKADVSNSGGVVTFAPAQPELVPLSAINIRQDTDGSQWYWTPELNSDSGVSNVLPSTSGMVTVSIPGTQAELIGISCGNTAEKNTDALVRNIVSGACIVFGPGVYNFDAFIFPASCGVKLIGNGSSITVFRFNANSCLKLSDKIYSDIYIKNICFESASLDVDTSSGGIIEKSSKASIKSLTFDGCRFVCPTNGQNGIRFTMYDDVLDVLSDILFLDCAFHMCSRMGIEIWASADATQYTVDTIKVMRCVFSGIGVTQVNGDYATSIACSIVCNLQSSIVIADCTFEDIRPNIGGGTVGGAIEVGRNTLVSRCIFRQDVGPAYCPVGVFTNAQNIGVIISECVEGKNSSHEFVYSDWKFFDCYDVLVTNCVIRGNVVARNAKLLRLIGNNVSLQIRMENSPSSIIMLGNKVGFADKDCPVWAKIPGCVLSCSNNSFYGSSATFLKDPANCELQASMNFYNT